MISTHPALQVPVRVDISSWRGWSSSPVTPKVVTGRGTGFRHCRTEPVSGQWSGSPATWLGGLRVRCWEGRPRFWHSRSVTGRLLYSSCRSGSFQGPAKWKVVCTAQAGIASGIPGSIPVRALIEACMAGRDQSGRNHSSTTASGDNQRTTSTVDGLKGSERV